MDGGQLIKEAIQAWTKAYAPYSKFKVGAAVLGGSGKVYHGCNVENASYGATLCGERVALGNAIANGETNIKAIALVAHVQGVLSPCGICRQVLAEFGPMTVYLGNTAGKWHETTIEELLPQSFDGSVLESG